MWGFARLSHTLSYIVGYTILVFGRTVFIQVRLTEAANGQVKINIFKVFVDLGLSSPISHSLFGHRRMGLGGISSKPLVDKKSFEFAEGKIT